MTKVTSSLRHENGQGVFTYTVEDRRGPGDVNFRTMRLWRPDNRYPGHLSVFRHESGGAVLQRDALRHGAKEPAPIIVDARDVDKLILSLLEIRLADPPKPWDPKP